MSRDRPNFLFSKVDWFSVREHQRSQMADEIARYDGNRLLNTPPEDLAGYFEEKYRVDVPVLREDEIVADQRETKIDFSQDRHRHIRDRSRPFHVNGTLIEVTVPFDGEKDAFEIQPSTHSLSPPAADVSDGYLTIQVTGTNLTREDVRQQIDRTLNEIKSALDNLRRDVKTLDDGLVTEARQAIDRRRDKLLEDQNLVSGLGFPLKDRSDSPRTFVAPEMKRKLQPKPPEASTEPYVAEPRLDTEHYEYVLKVMQNMAHVMERSPSAFEALDEEALRTHFLVQLNGHFEGAATGETFNYSGRTDILIRVNGKNIFIAECKFWGGPKKLEQTIDQLLGYSSWRDTKAAIVVFNKRKNFSKVVSSIPDVIRSHSNFKREIVYGEESNTRYVMSHPNDPSRELILTVLAFDVPESEG